MSGKPFPSPFADPPGVGDSAPPANVLWATINIGLAAGLVRAGRLGRRADRRPLLAAGAAGATAMAFFLSRYFGD